MGVVVLQERLAWADFGKAVCIILVVIFHAGDGADVIAWQASDPVWHHLNAFLRPIRMPLFFTISGLLAAASLQRPLSAVWRKRLLKNLYIYALWATALALWLPPLRSESTETLERLALAAIGHSTAWYIWALAIFYAAAYATRKLNAAIPIGAAILLSAAAQLGDTPVWVLRTTRCIPFFFIGARLPELVHYVTDKATWERAIALLSVAFIGHLFATGHLVSTAPGAAAGLMLAKTAVDRWHWPVRVGTWLGPRTLPIYLMHFLLLAFLRAVLPDSLILDGAAGATWPIWGSAVAVAGSILLHELILRSGGYWLFALPGRTSPYSRANIAPAR